MYNYQDSYDKVFASLYFIGLVAMCALLFMNVIVAILFDNYEDEDHEEENEEIKLLEEKAEELNIPSSVRDVIIHKDLLLDAKSKTSTWKSMKKY